MGQVFQVGDQYIDEETLKKERQKILDILKEEKRTYSMNIFILKETIAYLEDETKELANTKIFQ